MYDNDISLKKVSEYARETDLITIILYSGLECMNYTLQEGVEEIIFKNLFFRFQINENVLIL